MGVVEEGLVHMKTAGRKQTLVFLLFASISVPLFLFISLFLFHSLGSNYKHHNLLVPSNYIVITKKFFDDNHVVVFFLFSFIIVITIFLGAPNNKPPSSSSGSTDSDWFCSFPRSSSVHEACDSNDNENYINEACSYDDEQSWDLYVFHGYGDGYEEDNKVDHEEEEEEEGSEDDVDSEEEDKELERKIEEFIAKVYRERRDELKKDKASLYLCDYQLC